MYRMTVDTGNQRNNLQWLFLQYQLQLQHVIGFSVHWFLTHKCLVRLCERLLMKPIGVSAAHSTTS